MAFMAAAMPIIGMIATVGSTVLGVMSAASQARAAGQVAAVQAAAAAQQATASATASAYQMTIADQNQQIAKAAAESETLRGDEAARQQDLKTRGMIGAQMAAFGSSGVDVGTGSPTDINQSSRVLGRLDALNTKVDSNQRVIGFKNQGTSFGQESELLRQQMENQLKGGSLNVQAAGISARNASTRAGFLGAQSILSGVNTFATKWVDWQKPTTGTTSTTRHTWPNDWTTGGGAASP